MYDIISEQGVKKDTILSKVSEYEIYRYYLGKKFKINSVIRSPFHNDKHPSFGVFRSKNGKLLFKDLSLGYVGDCFKFIQILLNKPNYKDALLQVYTDLIVNNNNYKKVKQYDEPNEQDRAVLACKDIEFNDLDLDYWKKNNITKDILEKFNVFKTKYIILNDNIIKYSTNNNPIYTYKIFDKLKFYMPYEEKNKRHISGLGVNDFGGYEQLPKTGDLLIITKSIKDVMFLYSIGYTSICPPTEWSKIPTSIIDDLKARFKRILLLYDNDETGLKASKMASKTHSIEYIHIPVEYKEKDPTDFYKKYGLKKTIGLIKELINKK